jgi:hypothetical protein
MSGNYFGQALRPRQSSRSTRRYSRSPNPLVTPDLRAFVRQSYGGWARRFVGLNVGFLSVMVIWVLSACQGDSSSSHLNDSLFTTTLEIRAAGGISKSAFVFGEPIEFILSVHNKSNQTQKISLPSSEIFEFVVVQPNTSNILWRWSKGKAFLTVITDVEFQPDETRTWSIIWQQVDDAGMQVPVGNYEVKGMMATTERMLNPLKNGDLSADLTPFTIL